MKPTSANNPASRFVFYRQSDTTVEHLSYDPRVKVTRVTEDLNGDSIADLVLQWQGSPRIDDSNPEMAEMTEAGILKLYGPTVRCAVGKMPPYSSNLADVDIIAHGYLDAMDIKISADETKSAFNRTFKLRSILRRTLRSGDTIVQGRYMLSRTAAEALDDLPPSDDPIAMPWSTVATHVAALPAIFNLNGKPNRMKRPISYDAASSWGAYPIHVFTYDDDPNAEYWTFLQALRYLVMVYLPYTDLDSSVGPDNLFDVDRSGPALSPWWSKAESDIASPATVLKGWEEHMIRNCHSLAVDGKNLLEALQIISAQSGMRFHETHMNSTQPDEELRVLSWINFWTPGDNASECFSLERDGLQFDSSGNVRPVDDMLDASNTANASLQVDYGNTHSQLIVVGGREWLTVVSELVPGWLPNSRWDDVPSANWDSFNEDAATEDAPFASNKDGIFYSRFNVRGDQFADVDYMAVGRLWCIDPAGELDPDDYNRTFGPYNDYQPWEIPGVLDTVRRRRVMRKVPTADGEQDLGIVLEISIDSGVHWYPLETKCRLIPERTAICFLAPDLLAIGQTLFEDEELNTAEIKNLYDAYLQRVLRIRATFQIDTDARLIETVSTSASPLSAHEPTKMIIRAKDFQLKSTDTEVAASLAARLQERDDSETAERFAEAILADAAGSKWKGNVHIPWVEVSAYKLGTPIEGIRRAVGGPVEIEFGGSVSRNDLFPCVIQKVYRADDQGTDITLHDHSLRKALAPR